MRPFALALLVAAPALLAQAPALTFPEVSPRAQVSQKVGLTDMEVTYSRPAVKGRKVWDGLVPYGKVWRAGANENTVVAFSTPVSLGGVTLPAGRYGLHMLPTATTWTVIFSSQSRGWGSYGYDPKEDVVRLQVTPSLTEPTESLAYTFDDPGENGVILSLRWGKRGVPRRVNVVTKQVVVANLRNQLRWLHQFFPEGWSGAAGWCLHNDVNLEEARTWVDRSLAIKETFTGLRIKASLLEKKGDAQGAATLRAKALALATEGEVNQLGYMLLAQDKVDEAIGLFEQNVKAHPDSWNVYDSLAEALTHRGDKAQARANYQKALERVKRQDQRARIQAELDKLR